MVAAWIFWMHVAVLALGVLIASVHLVRSRGFVLWDAFTLLLPLPIWAALSITQLRPKSLSNLSEPILLLPFIMLIFLVRAYAFQTKSNQARSLIALAVTVGASVMVYAFTPMLEEGTCRLTTRWSGPWAIVGPTLLAHRYVAGPALCQ